MKGAGLAGSEQHGLEVSREADAEVKEQGKAGVNTERELSMQNFFHELRLMSDLWQSEWDAENMASISTI